jgi:hypothetical protein
MSEVAKPNDVIDLLSPADGKAAIHCLLCGPHELKRTRTVASCTDVGLSFLALIGLICLVQKDIFEHSVNEACTLISNNFACWRSDMTSRGAYMSTHISRVDSDAGPIASLTRAPAISTHRV